MTLPATIFVDVNVTLSGAAADKFSFGTLMGVFDHSATANRSDGPYYSVAEAEADGFTSAAEAEVHAWLQAVFAQENGVDSVLIGRIDVGDADLTASLNAIEEEAGSDGFYLLNCETRTDSEILLAAAWAETRMKVYIPQSSDADILTDGAGNIAEDLEALEYNRTALIYHQYDGSGDGDVPSDGYLDGAWSSKGGGLNLDAPNGVGVWAFHGLSGVTYDPLTSAQATKVYSNDANIYGRSKGLSFTSKGTMASGRFIDVTTTIDWLTARQEESILSLFVGVPTKVPFTSSGINQVQAAAQAVLDQGVEFGHLSPDSAPVITTPKIQNVSSADKIARQLTFSASCVLAGGIQKVVFNITVEQ